MIEIVEIQTDHNKIFFKCSYGKNENLHVNIRTKETVLHQGDVQVWEDTSIVYFIQVYNTDFNQLSHLDVLYKIADFESSFRITIKKKKIALISTYCNTEEKENILLDNIRKIKKLGIDVMAISPIKIKQEIVDECDFFIYTKENPLLKWPTRMHTHWYEQPIPGNKITSLHRSFDDYGWAGLYQVKKLSQIALTYDYDMFYHIIYDLEIDEVVESEFLSNNVNLVHPRRDPHHPETLWETTLHFMIFDREMMKKIIDEIKVEEYLRTNGVAEGEVLKWINKFDIKISDHPVKDKIFYFENFDFFNYSPFEDFKMFVSKNEPMTVWVGEKPILEKELPSKLRIVFHGFNELESIRLYIDGIRYQIEPKEWEIIEFDIDSLEIRSFFIEYKNRRIDFMGTYRSITMNQVYYNHRP